YGKFGFIPASEQLTTLLELSAGVAKPNTEFFIWPETALSSDRGGIDEEQFRAHAAYERVTDSLDDYKNGNVLSGLESCQNYNYGKAVTARDYGNGVFLDPLNAAVLIDQSSKLQFYQKSKLVPGLEQLPFGNSLSFM